MVSTINTRNKDIIKITGALWVPYINFPISSSKLCVISPSAYCTNNLTASQLHRSSNIYNIYFTKKSTMQISYTPSQFGSLELLKITHEICLLYVKLLFKLCQVNLHAQQIIGNVRGYQYIVSYASVTFCITPRKTSAFNILPFPALLSIKSSLSIIRSKRNTLASGVWQRRTRI